MTINGRDVRTVAHLCENNSCAFHAFLKFRSAETQYQPGVCWRTVDHQNASVFYRVKIKTNRLRGKKKKKKIIHSDGYLTRAHHYLVDPRL
jgi:hypothetical protein